MEVVKEIFIFIIIYAIIYGIFSFLTLELNPLKWCFIIRTIYISINLFILSINLCISLASIGIIGDCYYD